MQKRLLHAGCGDKGTLVPYDFASYRETRLDADPYVLPDIVASLVAMPMIEDDSFDAAYCSHCLEHLDAHEVPMALREFRRVLAEGGLVMIRVPDLQAIGGKLALDQADIRLYTCPLGVVTPLDMLYGHRASIAAGNTFMRHKTGFTRSVLDLALKVAGFEQVEVVRAELELVARAIKPRRQEGAETIVPPALLADMAPGQKEAVHASEVAGAAEVGLWCER